VKTRNYDDFDPPRSADLLLTIPESFDALLVKQPKTRIHVDGVAPYELHMLDGEAHGNQLRVVLNRLRQVRASTVRQGADH